MKMYSLSLLLVFSMSFNTTTADTQEAKSYNQNPVNGNLLVGRNDPSKYMPAQYGHGGAGTVRYMELTPREKFTTQFLFIHRGVFDPKSGLGEHVHRWMEEMYFVLDGNTAQFTVNGHTAELPGPCMVLCPMGASHGIYNPSDNTVQFMNVGVAYRDRQYDAVDLGKKDDLADTEIESPPTFRWSVLDKRLLRPTTNFLGGKGIVYKRAVWTTESFRTNWGYVNHYLLTPGSSIGYHRHDDFDEVYYIFSGKGRMTIDDVTIEVRAGDAGTVLIGGRHGLYNNSDEDIEVISIGVPLEKKLPHGVPLGDDLTKR